MSSIASDSWIGASGSAWSVAPQPLPRLSRLPSGPASGNRGSAEAREFGEAEEGDHRHSRQQAGEPGHHRSHGKPLGVGEQLDADRLVGRAVDASFRNEHAGRDGHDEGGDLRDNAVADREQGVGARRFLESQAFLSHADDHTADHVDEGDQDASHRVAAHELARAVHGAEEVALAFECPYGAGGLSSSSMMTGREISVDRHLLAWHGVEREARSDFRDAARPLGDRPRSSRSSGSMKTTTPMTKLPLITKLPKASMTLASGFGAFVAVRPG